MRLGGSTSRLEEGSPFFLFVALAATLTAAATLASPRACADEPGLTSTTNGAAQTIRVGRDQTIKRISDAARVARDGDTVEIEAGEYIGDTAVWSQRELTIRGVDGRVELIAAGRAAEGKAIWVVRGQDVVIENIVFTGAKVPDRNGAGIRLESGKLTVRRCAFIDNEEGILASNRPTIVLEIEDSEFGRNGYGDGQSHNLYAGAIGRLSVKGSYFHHARVGHLLKSRARENLIFYNRLADEPGGSASYELEFPNGGFAVVVGNLIEQGSQTENSTIVSYGAEGYKWPRNELYLASNTIVNDRTQGGAFIHAAAGPALVKAVNNIFVGKGILSIHARSDFRSNWTLGWPDFVRPMDLDFRLRAGSKAVGAAIDAGEVDGISLRPAEEYRYPVGTVPIRSSEQLSPGAFQAVVH